jgi:hypothetical protein
MLLAQLDGEQIFTITEPDLQCEFLDCFYWSDKDNGYLKACDKNTPNNANFQYSKMNCKEVATTKIASGTDVFYLNSKINYGDIFLMGFLILFSSFIILKFIWDIINPRIVKVKTLQDL